VTQCQTTEAEVPLCTAKNVKGQLWLTCRWQ